MALPVSAGGIVLASDINELADSAWTSYGSAGTIVTAVTTSPTLGTSTWSAAYLATTDLVIVRFSITINTTAPWNAGSGAYLILLPFAASTGSISGSVGSAWMDDFGTAPRIGAVYAASSTTVSVWRDSTSAAIGSGGPGSAWATNDKLALTYAYEPA